MRSEGKSQERDHEEEEGLEPNGHDEIVAKQFQLDYHEGRNL
jgi:hypothetical protein